VNEPTIIEHIVNFFEDPRYTGIVTLGVIGMVIFGLFLIMLIASIPDDPYR
jgi:hypothetical protein